MGLKKKLIHFLGGFTEEEYNNLQKSSNWTITKLNEENEILQKNLKTLQWEVEDSHSTAQVNFAKVEKPIYTFIVENILEEKFRQTEEESIVYAKRYIAEQFVDTLLKNKMIDFKISDYDFQKIIVGTIYVREP